MIEKVNPAHPDKVADRIAGAIVDLAYEREENPRIAVEGMVGHGTCFLTIESSVKFAAEELIKIVYRISGIQRVQFQQFPQDRLLAGNQSSGFRCGDNGIFRGVPITDEQKRLSKIAHKIYDRVSMDGKYILADGRLIICQSCADKETILDALGDDRDAFETIINPLGYWTGGPDVDTGAVNRKLGSDMADSVTGGGIHGKDLTKADVSVNIYAFLKAQAYGEKVELSCAIGDRKIDGQPYGEIVKLARKYVDTVGGFEKLAEWGLF